MAFGLGVLGIIMGIVFFLCSERPCSGGKSLGKVREPGTRVPVSVCARILHLVWGPGLYAAGWGSILVSGDPVTDSYLGAQKHLGAGEYCERRWGGALQEGRGSLW